MPYFWYHRVIPSERTYNHQSALHLCIYNERNWWIDSRILETRNRNERQSKRRTNYITKDCYQTEAEHILRTEVTKNPYFVPTSEEKFIVQPEFLYSRQVSRG